MMRAFSGAIPPEYRIHQLYRPFPLLPPHPTLSLLLQGISVALRIFMLENRAELLVLLLTQGRYSGEKDWRGCLF